MHNITIKIRARRISKTPNTIDQAPPINAETSEVANVKMANVKSIMIATTNEIIGEYLGRQWVNVILKSPSPIAIMKV